MQAISFEELAYAKVAVFSVLSLRLVEQPGAVTCYEGVGRCDHMLYYITQGCRDYRPMGGEPFRSEPRDILLMPGGCRYRSDALPGTLSVGYIARFTLLDAQGEPVLLEGGVRRLLADGAGYFEQMFEALARCGMQSRNLRTTKLLYEVLDEMTRVQAGSSSGRDSVKAAQEYMHSHLQYSIKLSFLAELCHMSVRTFCRRFVEAAGISPVAYHRQLRVLKACELLESSLYTVEAAAEMMGFADGAHFSRVFRKQMGYSPGVVHARASRGRAAANVGGEKSPPLENK